MAIPFFQEIRIENTNSCGYKCMMCPRESLTRRIGYMSIDDFSLILERIGPYHGFFHLHGYGEPLLDRQLIVKVLKLKEKIPSSIKLIFTTLGVRVDEDYFGKLLDAGLDAIVVSMYGFTREEYKKIHGFDGFERVLHNLQLLSVALKRRPKFFATLKIPSQSIASSLPIHHTSLERNEFCQWARDLGLGIEEWSFVHNYGNGREYNVPNTQLKCPVINGKRRNVLNITWDMDVIPCCYDFNARIPFGNLRKQSLAEIFSSPEYLAFVIAHQTEDLSAYPVCQNCEKLDYF
ncbi:MAG: hypothetical protein HW387_570 [Parachlamydiales bacterium]|nr:hypothetical protein [Parachlamydiales bacterium]